MHSIFVEPAQGRLSPCRGKLGDLTTGLPAAFDVVAVLDSVPPPSS